jgi:outer membrane protein insertion porin family
MARWIQGDNVPIFERLFLGGANNLRGYDYRDAGPKDVKGEPIGGNMSIYGSTEYSFRIIEKFRGAFFWDVGMVSGGYNSTDAARAGYPAGLNVIGEGEIYSNVGIGVRMFLPIGPIRIDLGVPMVKDKYVGQSPRFNFNMGYKF